MNPEHNLDYLAAQYAQKVIESLKNDPKKAEISLTKALGVLQENGVYACFLYLRAREDNGNKIIAQMRNLLKALGLKDKPQDEPEKALGLKDEPQDDLEYARQLTTHLPNLLLAKEALEQMLIYARYGAKAANKQ